MLSGRICTLARNNLVKSVVCTQPLRFMSNRTMDILLVKDIEGLGRAGQKVAVKPGRARNHLIPGGMAHYNTPEGLEKMKALFGPDFVVEEVDEEEQVKSTAVSTPWEVQADVMRRLKWSYLRRPTSNNDFSVKKVITKQQVLNTIRAANFHWVTLNDIVFPRGMETIANFGEFPVAVLLETPDTTDYVRFTIKIGIADEDGSGEGLPVDEDIVEDM